MRQLYMFSLVPWLLILYCKDASSHEIRPALLQLKQIKIEQQKLNSQDFFEVTWKKPMLKGKQFSLYPIFPKACRALSSKSSYLTADAIIKSWKISCNQDEYLQQNIIIEGLTPTITDVFLQIDWNNHPATSILLNANNNFVQFQTMRTGSDTVNQSYFKTGLFHLLNGYDHLLLILLLLLLINRARVLVLTLTAFTIAHSITLAMASFNLIVVKASLIESLIALSILILAIEVSVKIKSTDENIVNPLLVAFIFGLVHGLGFASNIQLNAHQHSIVHPLLFFNLGIETGQLLIVAILLTLKGWAKHYVKNLLKFKQIAIFASGTIATYWFLQSLQVLFSGIK